jgi:hypothetical protein
MSCLKSRKLCPTITALFCIAIASPAALADSGDRPVSEFASGTGTDIFLLTGIVLPLLTDGQDGVQHSLRTFDSFAVSSLLTTGLKEITNVKRPDSDARDSFPSLHASSVFAIATMESHYHPDYAPLWYAGATLIAYSRVDLNRHRITEVLTGAAIGYLTARLELSQKHGLLLFPIIESDREETKVGLQISTSF